MAKKSLILTITGRVQGVGYRYGAQQAARQHRIKGFVKNQSDGSVYIEAEGESTDIEHFVQWCRRGPSWASVNDVKIQEKPFSDFQSFAVR